MRKHTKHTNVTYEKVTFGVDPINKYKLKLTTTIIEESVKIHWKLTVKIQNLRQCFIIFIVKLGLISHLVSVHLLLTWACYCLIFVQKRFWFSKFWGSFTSFRKQDVNWTYISRINVHLKIYAQGDCSKQWKFKTMFLGKVRIITQRCHVKENINKRKVNWRKPLKKISSLLQLRTPHQRTVVTGPITNFCKNSFSNML